MYAGLSSFVALEPDIVKLLHGVHVSQLVRRRFRWSSGGPARDVRAPHSEARERARGERRV